MKFLNTKIFGNSQENARRKYQFTINGADYKTASVIYMAKYFLGNLQRGYPSLLGSFDTIVCICNIHGEVFSWKLLNRIPSRF